MSGHHGGRQERQPNDLASKRRREDIGYTSRHHLLESLIYLGDDKLPALCVEEGLVTGVLKHFKRELRVHQQETVALLADCILSLPTKTPLYALFVGILNVEEPSAVDDLLAALSAAFASGLLTEGNGRHARIVVRFFAALVPLNVLDASSVTGQMASIIDQASRIMEQGDRCGPRQLYADFLMYAALSALPYGGGDLVESSLADIKVAYENAAKYCATRPLQNMTALHPFAVSIKEDDHISQSDFGACTFLPNLIGAVGEYLEAGNWQLTSIPCVHTSFIPVVAAAEPRSVPDLVVPNDPLEMFGRAIEDEQRAGLLLERFPPRGWLQLLEAKHTEGDRLVLERIIVEDYILDIVDGFEGDRVECAKRLVSGLPVPFAYEPLLCQTLFGQMLCLPRSAYKPIMYGTLMVDLCKLQKLFPRAMSACVRECFARMNVLDPELRLRLAQWLAYHLSNFEYVWPWQKWQHVLDAPPFDGQRRFCVAIMDKLIRLSYWERIQSVIPEEFRVLLPPKPAAEVPEDGSEESEWTSKMLKLVRSKAKPEEVDSWIETEKAGDALGGAEGVLRALVRTLLIAGAKSYTHMVIAMERYYGPVAMRTSSLRSQGQRAVLEVAAAVWAKSSQRTGMAVDRLMTLRIVSVTAVIDWVFESGVAWSVEDGCHATMAWEILHNAVDKAIARVQDAREDMRTAQQELDKFSHLPADGDVAVQRNAARENADQASEYLKETAEEQKVATVSCVRHFVRSLEGEWKDLSVLQQAAGEGDAAAAIQSYKQQCFASFLRRYFKQMTELASSIRALELPPSVSGQLEKYLTLSS